MALFELYHHHQQQQQRHQQQQLAEASVTLMTSQVCLIGNELNYIPAHNPFS